VGGGIYYVQLTPEEEPGGGAAVVGNKALNQALEESLQVFELDELDEDVLAEVDRLTQIDSAEVERVVEAFLESDSVDGIEKLIRDPDRVKPLMLGYYKGQEVEPVGYRSFDQLQVLVYQGDQEYLTGIVTMRDFSSNRIALFAQEIDGVEKYVVDWESWVGYSEKTPELARAEKPTEPFMVRAILSSGSYFNYGFSDDSKWHAYNMEFQNSDDTFLAYTMIGSDVDSSLRSIWANNEMTGVFTIKVRYPKDARAGNQVEIVEVIDSSWFSITQSQEQ